MQAILPNGATGVTDTAGTAELDGVRQAILSIHIAEYNALRSEVDEMIKAQGQLVLYALVAMGAAIPILSVLLQNQVWASLLVVPMVFSSVAWAYLGYLGGMYRLAIYIHTQLRPAIGTLLRQASPDLEFEVLSWDRFARTGGLNMLLWPRGFELFFLVLPSVGSIILYLAIQNTIGVKLNWYHWLLVTVDSAMTIGAIVVGVLISLVAVRWFRRSC